MRYVIKNKDNGKLLIDSKLDDYTILFTQVNGNRDEAWIYVRHTTSRPKPIIQKIPKEFRR